MKPSLESEVFLGVGASLLSTPRELRGVGRAVTMRTGSAGKRRYAKAIVIYDPDADAVRNVSVSYGTVHDVRLVWAVLDEIVYSVFFERVVGDKGFDSSEVMMYIDEHCLVPCIDVRGGMLEPRFGIRLVSKMNYDALRSERGNVRPLVEFLFSSVKALGRGFVRISLRVLRPRLPWCSWRIMSLF